MTQITTEVTTKLAEVDAYPYEVRIVLSLKDRDDCLTPTQARDLGKLLIESADRAEHMHYEDDGSIVEYQPKAGS